MSEKECSLHKDKRRKRLRRFCGGLLILIFIILIIVLLVWAILQPKKPRFVLQDATVYAFNVTAPNFLTSTILVTIASRNPNDKIGVYYDKLDIFAIYQNQQITYYTAIPPTYQGHKEIIVWSPIVSGVNVPVAPYNGVGLGQDQADGTVILTIKIQGQVRFKVGTFISGHYRLSVNCPANIVFGNPTPGIVVGNPTPGIVVGNGIKYQMDRSCSVSL
ncbi:NDR1/HIN1-like protein 1 [Camellia lanceoleosa]|uniref:NDR1/HIN1-like protein 1 n=1 Tax=Camellia lanceoleosa TaxID=1840588 RepID=A0ACC0GB26_9ERIC|nr:NDR1/HIN1-like protein 1 [Camellia lanceoleosa]